jgi:copper chaperone
MTLQLKVSSMACSACSDTIASAVKAVDPGATVQADLKTKQVEIEAQASEAAIKRAIEAAGYPIA